MTEMPELEEELHEPDESVSLDCKEPPYQARGDGLQVGSTLSIEVGVGNKESKDAAELRPVFTHITDGFS